jgi:hypothetical protein
MKRFLIVAGSIMLGGVIGALVFFNFGYSIWELFVHPPVERYDYSGGCRVPDLSGLVLVLFGLPASVGSGALFGLVWSIWYTGLKKAPSKRAAPSDLE